MFFVMVKTTDASAPLPAGDGVEVVTVKPPLALTTAAWCRRFLQAEVSRSLRRHST